MTSPTNPNSSLKITLFSKLIFLVFIFFSFTIYTNATETRSTRGSDACIKYLKNIDTSDSKIITHHLSQVLKAPGDILILRGLQESYYKAIALGIKPSIVTSRLSLKNLEATPRYKSGYHEAYYLAVALGLNQTLVKLRLNALHSIPPSIRYNSNMQDAYYIALALGVPHADILSRIGADVFILGNEYTYYNRPNINQAYYIALALGLDKTMIKEQLLQAQFPPVKFQFTDGATEAYYFAIVMKDYLKTFRFF